MTAPLEAGTPFPSVTGKDADGNPVDIAESVAGNWAFVQFYRGDW